MPATITEKIIAGHAGSSRVRPGELVEVDVDLALVNDITGPLAIEVFRTAGQDRVHDASRLVMVMDHFAPAPNIKAAEQIKACREFAAEQGVDKYYDLDRAGIEHALLPEQGLVLPGDLVVGADSHTCTYGALAAFATGMGSTDLAGIYMTGRTWLRVPASIKFVYRGRPGPWIGGKDLILMTIGDIGVDGALYRAMEFCGPAIDDLSVEGRLTMCNMAIEAGAKNGVIAPDQATTAFADQRAGREYTVFRSDEDAEYDEVREYDVSDLEPQVAAPHLPSNTVGVSRLKDVTIDQAVIGSCTNGRLEDLRTAARVLEGRRVAPGLRLIVIPATRDVYQAALEEGLIEIFHRAGGAVGMPTCGPCLGGHMGVLAGGERAVATTNRNFRGRMGHQTSEVYLAGPAVAAASAAAGRIVGPDDL